MAKVIVERPRYRGRTKRGMRKGYRREVHRALTHTDASVAQESITARGDDKHFGEHLGPLRRYVDSHVGRPWDGVLSEIRKHIDAGNVVQNHILTHLFHYVEIEAVLIDGQPHYPPHCRWG